MDRNLSLLRRRLLIAGATAGILALSSGSGLASGRLGRSARPRRLTPGRLAPEATLPLQPERLSPDTAVPLTSPHGSARSVPVADPGRIRLFCPHTGEGINTVYFADGRYRPEALRRLNLLLRDWRTGAVTDIDPALIDILAAIQRSFPNGAPLHVLSGFRTPQTNAMLARQSAGVATNSLHLYGRAADFFVPRVAAADLRDQACALSAGGVGFYPAQGFIHVDTGVVRSWG